jgi:hypothetical protein
MSTPAFKTDVFLVYKNSKRANAKVRMKRYRHKAIDEILEATNRRLHIPEKSVILEIGFGKSFERRYKKKYKL